MKSTDWSYDFSSLPRWENRETFLYVYDEFYEIPQQDMLCCIYSITEISMLNYVGFLAILKGKDNPSLWLNVADNYVFCVNFSVSRDGSLIFLQPSIYDKNRGYERPILIINLKEKRFAHVLTRNHNPLYEVKQKTDHIFVVEAHESQKNEASMQTLDGKEIHTDELKWYPMNKIHSLPKMIFGKRNSLFSWRKK